MLRRWQQVQFLSKNIREFPFVIPGRETGTGVPSGNRALLWRTEAVESPKAALCPTGREGNRIPHAFNPKVGSDPRQA